MKGNKQNNEIQVLKSELLQLCFSSTRAEINLEISLL